MTLSDIVDAQNLYQEVYKKLFSTNNLYLSTSELFSNTYRELFEDEFVPSPSGTTKDILLKYVSCALVNFSSSVANTAKSVNPFFASGDILNSLLISVNQVPIQSNITASILFQINTATGIPFTLESGAIIVDDTNTPVFELNTNFSVMGVISSVYFTAVNGGASYNGLSGTSIGGTLSFAPRGGTSDDNIASYTIFSSFGGIDVEDTNAARLRYFNSFDQQSAGSPQNYKATIKSSFKEVTDVYVSPVNMSTRGTVNIYITLIGGQVYDSAFLSNVASSIRNVEPATDSIVVNYALQSVIDLTGINVFSNVVLTDDEKKSLLSTLYLFFSPNTIGLNFYKSSLLEVLQASNNKIVGITIPSCPEVVVVGDTNFSVPNIGSGITYNIIS